MSAAEPRKHVWRNRFTAAVFLALLVSALFQWLRPQEGPETFRPPDEIELAPLELPPGEHEARGRLVDHEGRAVADSVVQVLAGGRPHWTYTDEAGAFALADLPDGAHAAVVLAKGYMPEEFTLTVPQATEASWRLPEREYPIEYLPQVERTDRDGRVEPSVGSEVEGCEVVFDPEPGQPFRGATMRREPVGASGAFLVDGLVHGVYRVSVLPGWASGGSWPALTSFRYIHTDSPPDLVVPLESGKLRGDLRDDRGRPVHAALILVSSYEDEQRLWPPASSDESGAFEVPDLPPGRYRVEVRAGRHASNSLIDVPIGTTVSLELGPIRTD